jgi:hypothetical protein
MERPSFVAAPSGLLPISPRSTRRLESFASVSSYCETPDSTRHMIRLAGTTVYESEAFHRLCDELGLLVWQDMMFANMDYPFEDAEFRQTVRAEAEAELSRLSRHPSSAVICGNSEIEQQAAMLGLDPALGRGPFFDEELPRIAARCCPGVPYIRSSPCGAGLPFHPRSGVAHYFGVGAYRRPMEEVRRAEIRFASECLAFANVAEPEMPAEVPLAADGMPALPVRSRKVAPPVTQARIGIFTTSATFFPVLAIAPRAFGSRTTRAVDPLDRRGGRGIPASLRCGTRRRSGHSPRRDARLLGARASRTWFSGGLH